MASPTRNSGASTPQSRHWKNPFGSCPTYLTRTASLDIKDTTDAEMMKFDDGAGYMPEHFTFRRAMSVPSTVDSGFPTTKSLSKRPSFKLQLPETNVFTGPSISRESNPDASGPSRIYPQQVLNFMSILTPPDESSIFEWEMASQVRQGPQPVAFSPTEELERLLISETGAVPSSQGVTSSTTMGMESASSALPTESAGSSSALEEAVQSIISIMNDRCSNNTTISMVYQALPCPIVATELAPHSYTTSALQLLLDALRPSLSTESARWLHIVHALPENSPLAIVPTSPPVTPAGHSHIGSQGGYFDIQNVIHNGVLMVDRHQPSGQQGPLTLAVPPPLSSFAVPPSTTHVSLYERFIPPRTSQEYLDLFNSKGPSSLVDRLTELSSTGSLIFVYPTKRGAQKFSSEYLGPVLNPVIRTMISIHGLSADLGTKLGAMETVDSLSSFDKLQSKLRGLISKLNDSPACKNPYSLIYGKSETVQINRKIWEHWWVQQETPRVKSVMADYFKRGHSLPSDSLVTPTSLAREVLEGVAKRGNSPGEDLGEGSGIEVGVFVISRST